MKLLIDINARAILGVVEDVQALSGEITDEIAGGGYALADWPEGADIGDLRVGEDGSVTEDADAVRDYLCAVVDRDKRNAIDAADDDAAVAEVKSWASDAKAAITAAADPQAMREAFTHHQQEQ